MRESYQYKEYYRILAIAVILACAFDISLSKSAHSISPPKMTNKKVGSTQSKVVWKTRVWQGTPSQIAKGDNGLIFFCIDKKKFSEEYRSQLYASNQDNGRVRWSKEIPGARTIWLPLTPAVEGNTLYVATYANKVLAFDAVDGTQRWSYQMEDKGSNPEDAIVSSPTVSSNIVYVANRDYLHAIDGSNGELLWRERAPFSFNSTEKPAVSMNHIFLFRDEKLVALDAKSGRMSWQIPSKYSRIVCEKGKVYALGCMGIITCMNENDGKILWVSDDVGDAFWGMTVVDGLLCIHSRKIGDEYSRLMAIDIRNGKIKWRYAPVDNAREPLISRNGTVYTILSPKMVAVDGKKHRLVDSIDLGLEDDYSYSSPSMGDDGRKFIVNGATGQLYAIQ